MRIATNRHNCRLQRPTADNLYGQAEDNAGVARRRDKLEARLCRRSEIYRRINLIESSFG